MHENNRKDLEEVCQLMDKLTVDTLTLIERDIQQQIDLERLLVEGDGNLTKSRYIMGHNNVTQLQLPTGDSPEFDALAVIYNQSTESNQKALDLRTPEKCDSEHKTQDPLKWFGVLVPQCLHLAQLTYRQALVAMVQLVNTQNCLKYSYESFKKLEVYKNSLTKEE